MDRAFWILIGYRSSYLWLPNTEKQEAFLLNVGNYI